MVVMVARVSIVHDSVYFSAAGSSWVITFRRLKPLRHMFKVWQVETSNNQKQLEADLCWSLLQTKTFLSTTDLGSAQVDYFILNTYMGLDNKAQLCSDKYSKSCKQALVTVPYLMYSPSWMIEALLKNWPQSDSVPLWPSCLEANAVPINNLVFPGWLSLTFSPLSLFPVACVSVWTILHTTFF